MNRYDYSPGANQDNKERIDYHPKKRDRFSPMRRYDIAMYGGAKDKIRDDDQEEMAPYRKSVKRTRSCLLYTSPSPRD